MAEDFQHIIEDNICLKKALHTTRHQNEKLQQELNEMRFNYQQLLDKNTALNHTYNQFQKRNQLQTAQHNKDIATLTSQIEELKLLIQQKHQELQAFQIKIIPNLDQDMIRVKLITEMQGPYQEEVEKKEREILRLKEKLTGIERKYNVTQLQLQTKEKELKRQLEQTKQFYQNENSKLLKELNNVLNKKEIKTYDKELFRNQRKQLDELRLTIDMQSKNQMDLKKELMNLKVQKQKLLIRLSQMNQKKAMQLHLTSQNAELRSIKQENKRLQDQIVRKSQENQRLDKKLKNCERQYKINEDQIKRNSYKQQQKWETQRETLKEEARKLKDQNRKLQGLKQRTQEQNQIFLQKLKAAQKENQVKNLQINKLKTNIGDLQRNITEYEHARKKKLSLSKDLMQQQEQIKPKKREENTAKKQNIQKTINIKNEDKDHITQLEKANTKLKQKLQLANKKIIQLLKQKASLPKFGSDHPDMNVSISRDRAFSNIEIKNTKSHKPDNKGLLLEYRDASFIPLVPPTVYAHQRK